MDPWRPSPSSHSLDRYSKRPPPCPSGRQYPTPGRPALISPWAAAIPPAALPAGRSRPGQCCKAPLRQRIVVKWLLLWILASVTGHVCHCVRTAIVLHARAPVRAAQRPRGEKGCPPPTSWWRGADERVVRRVFGQGACLTSENGRGWAVSQVRHVASDRCSCAEHPGGKYSRRGVNESSQAPWACANSHGRFHAPTKAKKKKSCQEPMKVPAPLRPAAGQNGTRSTRVAGRSKNRPQRAAGKRFALLCRDRSLPVKQAHRGRHQEPPNATTKRRPSPEKQRKPRPNQWISCQGLQGRRLPPREKPRAMARKYLRTVARAPC